jgi:hypothetical protein
LGVAGKDLWENKTYPQYRYGEGISDSILVVTDKSNPLK